MRYRKRLCLSFIAMIGLMFLIAEAGASAHTINTGAQTMHTSPSKSLPAGVLFRNGPLSKKEVALTFDDGPDIQFTPQILDILKKEGVKATFFLVGKSSKRYPAIVQRIAEEGHVIGNHSWDHRLLTRLTPEEIRHEIVQTDQTLSNIVGYHTLLFRPPYGAASTDNVLQIASMDYKVIDWSVDTLDWKSKNAAEIIEIVNRTIQPGGIILEHSAGPKALKHTVESLPELIRMLKAKGYSLVTVPQLLEIPAFKN
jgi:peptidoglycan-N-acetylglucosamine deacetylase